MGLFIDIMMGNLVGKPFHPLRGYSERYSQWIATIDWKTCLFCRKTHGTVYENDALPLEQPPVHPNCRCYIDALMTIAAGTASMDREKGADVWTLSYGRLPEKYLTKQEAETQGWSRWRGNLDTVLPGRMIGGDIYENRNRHLPYREGRVWHEADINYTGGYRNDSRVVYSNDGLVFVTYDHFHSFYEIVPLVQVQPLIPDTFIDRPQEEGGL